MTARGGLLRSAGFVALALCVAAPLAVRPGMPLFVHDWSWSPDSRHTLWTWHFLISAWSLPGLGSPNSAMTMNPLAWLKLAPSLVLGGREAQLCYLLAGLTFAFAGLYRIATNDLELDAPYAWLATLLFASSPFVFTKIASGQSSYWTSMAAFVWGVSLAAQALREERLQCAFAAATAFALATLQPQFLVFTVVVITCLWVVRPSRKRTVTALVMLVCSPVLLLPELIFLSMRGPESGASISFPYPFWRLSQSSFPLEATALLGYAPHYVERSVAAIGGTLPIFCGAVSASALALSAPVLRRSRESVAFALTGLVGWMWLCGVDGPAAPLWNFAFDHFAAAAFLREFYHGGILLAFPLAVLSATGIAALFRRRRAAGFAFGSLIVVAFGYATWTGGLARVLPQTTIPDEAAVVTGLHVGPIAQARVAFLPARIPLRTGGDVVGGTDGADWAAQDEISIFKYYLDPLSGIAADAVYRDDARGEALFARLGVNALVVRDWLESGAYEKQRFQTARSEALGAMPMFGAARTTAQLPADQLAAATAEATYLDIPGRDANDTMVAPVPFEPDLTLGWVGRRDVATATSSGPGGTGDGVATSKPGARARFSSPSQGRALVWTGGIMRLDGRPVRAPLPRWIATPPAFEVVNGSDVSAVYETGERAFTPASGDAATLGRAVLDDVRAVAPWAYSGALHLDGAAVVVLRQRYDPDWNLSGDGLQIVRHLRADGFANAWVVRGRGDIRIAAIYGYQSLDFVLLAASLVGFLALAAATVRGGAVRRKV